MTEKAARHVVGAVADARAVMVGRGGGDAEPVEIGEAGHPGAVAADAGVIQDHRADMRRGGDPGGKYSAVRRADHDPAGGLGAELGHAVDDDRAQVRGR